MIDWSLYLITDRKLAVKRSLVKIVQAAIAGGATILQLREKNRPTQEIIKFGLTLRKITKSLGIPLIVNDRPDIALAIEADGVHLGQEDMTAIMGRRLLGPRKIIGVTASNPHQAKKAQREGANYLGASDIFGTATKPDAGVPIGLKTLKAIVESVSIPVVGVGGVNKENASQVIKQGAAGIAVISAIIGASDPKKATSELSKIVKKAKKS